MASEPEAAADAAARLEAALERIARLAATPGAGRDVGRGGDPAYRADSSEWADPSRAVLASRLDRIIERLRDALDQGA
ncbi:MAG: hypothetical protein HIU82_18635 [Proteobacteria bacterium]|nr:hypothetical protein [Pseudomonadota bacterium]